MFGPLFGNRPGMEFIDRLIHPECESHPFSQFIGRGEIVDISDFGQQCYCTYRTCRVPQLMSVLLTEFMSVFDIFSVFVEIDFVHVD
jgi:hypothetical protein